MNATRDSFGAGYPVHESLQTVVIFPCFQRETLHHANACAKAWHELGFRVRLLLADDCADKETGNDPAGIERIVMPLVARETEGFPLHQVISDAEAAHPGFSLLLANLPVMPRVRNGHLEEFWAELGGILLMSVEFAADHELHDFAAPEPFLDGCDALYLREDRIAGMREFLDSSGCVEAVLLGHRGWDIVIGENLLAEELPAAMGPTGILTAVAPQAYLLRDRTLDLAEAGLVAGNENSRDEDAAEDLVPAMHAADARIRFSVRLQQRAAQRWGMRATFLDLPRPRLAGGSREEAARLHDLVIAPTLVDDPDLGFMRIARWLEAAPAGGDSVLGSLAYFARSPSWHYRFAQALAALCLRVESRGTPRISKANETNRVASHNLRRLLRDTSMPDYLQRYLVLELFAIFLFDAGQLSLELHDYLALSCENDIERDLLRALMNGISKDHAHVA